MILNKGSHPVKHDRSSPRYVAVLLGSVAAALSAFRRLQTAGHKPTFGTDVKVRPNLQCYRAVVLCRRNVYKWRHAVSHVKTLLNQPPYPKWWEEQSEPRHV